jgi:hypothetical protein
VAVAVIVDENVVVAVHVNRNANVIVIPTVDDLAAACSTGPDQAVPASRADGALQS